MEQKVYIQFNITEEQIQYTKNLVDYSIQNHKVQDVFKNDPHAKGRQYEYRTTGTLGEVVFADAYCLERPLKSFGAVDGQDYGRDFILNFNYIHPDNFSVDIKTMRRKNCNFKEDYVFNIPYYQVNKSNVITDYYYFITISNDYKNNKKASLIGYISRNDIKNGTSGILYKKGEKRIKDNNDFFIFHEDTYEIKFKEICPPIINENIKKIDGFEIKNIKTSKKCLF